MHLYLVQHGLALPKETDPDRPLSPEGRADIERLGDFVARAGVQVARTLHSGKTRAEQTAAILASGLMPGGKPHAHPGLAPADAVEPVADEIRHWDLDTLLVGHQPFMGRLASLLVTGSAQRELVSFEPGSLVCLERGEAGEWTLAWMIRPGLLRTGKR
jgi:phosphohistidine phosphatase